MAVLKWVAAAALLWPCVAHADAASILAAIGYAAEALGASGYIVAAIEVAAVVAAVYGAAQARRQARSDEAKQKADYNASLVDRSVTTLSAEPPWQVIYGRCITGGYILGIFTSDKTDIREDGTTYVKPDAYKHLVIYFAAHECEAINDILIEGVSLGPLDGSGNTQVGSNFYNAQTVLRTVNFTTTITVAEPVTSIVNATQAGIDSFPIQASTVSVGGGGLVINDSSGLPTQVTYTASIPFSTVRVQKHLGVDDQAADAYLMSAVPSQWTSTDRLRGLCYIVVTLDLEDSRFQGGPPNITADISGRKVLDTRTGLTAWGQNPALIIRDYLTAEWGFNALPSDVDASYCNASANACDALINIGATYTCNGVISTDGSSESILDDLGACMGGFAVYGGSWLIIAGTWTPPVMNLVDDNLDGQIEIVQAGAGIDDIFNGVRGTFIGASQSTPTDFVPYQNATFAAADGEDLWSDITLPYTNDMGRCRNLARIQTERSRSSQVIKYPAKLIAWPLQIGDRVTVTSAEYGFVQKTYRVTDWQFGITAPVVLQLQEDAAEIYDLADAVTPDPTPNTGLPDPWIVAALTGVTATSDATTALLQADGSFLPRVLVEWDAVTDAYIANGNGRIEILYHGTGTTVYREVDAAGYETSAYLVGATARDFITIKIRAVNELGVRGPDVILSHNVANGAIGGTTNVFVGTPPGLVTVTGISGIPNNTTSGRNTLLNSVTFTPTADGDAQVYFEAHGSYSAGGSIGNARWVIQDTSVSLIVGNRVLQTSVPASTSIEFPMSSTRSIAVTAGTSYTFGVYANKLNSGDTYTVDNMELRVEIVSAS